MPDSGVVVVLCRRSIDRQRIARFIEDNHTASVLKAATIALALRHAETARPTHILIDRDLAEDPGWPQVGRAVAQLLLNPAPTPNGEDAERRASERGFGHPPCVAKPDWADPRSAQSFEVRIGRWVTDHGSAPRSTPGRRRVPPQLVAIGASTGGPQALAQIIPQLHFSPARPILIVNHMPSGFTEQLAAELNRLTPLEVREARDGERLTPGVILLAPAGRHMHVVRERRKCLVQLDDGPEVNSCRPSVDVLFESLVDTFGEHTLAVILTGMGQDGAHGAMALAEAGARILIQSEDTATAYGMPRAAAAAVRHKASIVPLDQLPHEISNAMGKAQSCS